MSKNIIKSPLDERDFKAINILNFDSTLPDEYIAPSTPVRFQWFSSQCVCFAATSAMSQQEKLLTGDCHIYSPGLIYANRESDDWQGEGWYVRKALKQLYKYGTCLEKDFPLAESFNTEKRKFEADKENLLSKASEHKISNYFRCYTEDEIKRCIIQKGAVIMSCSWYTKCPAFLQYYFKGDVDKSQMRGGHAMMIIGWNKNNQWIIQDSYTSLRPIGGKILMDFNYPIDEYWGITI